MMSCAQASACFPNLKLGGTRGGGAKREARHGFVRCGLTHRDSDPICFSKRNGCQGLVAGRLENTRSSAICMARGNEGFSWDSLKNAFRGMNKQESVQDWLKKQMKENELYDDDDDDGGDGGRPGGGGGDGFGGEEDESLTGILDELLQVIMGTIGIFFVYIYLIRGAELTRLARDYIKYLFGSSPSMRLQKAMAKWRRFRDQFYVTDDPRVDWLERAIVDTPTWWHKRSEFIEMAREMDDDDDEDY